MSGCVYHCEICLKGWEHRPRDVDAVCKHCEKGFCGKHIGEHLVKVHMVSLKWKGVKLGKRKVEVI